VTLQDEPSAWGVVTAEGFRPADIANLAGASIGAIRVPDAIATVDCEALLDALRAVRYGTYDPVRVSPPVGKFGPAINDYRANGRVGAEYWTAVSEAHEALREFPEVARLLATSRELLAANWRGEVVVASHGGRAMLAGIVREINAGTQIHDDDIVREYSADLLGCELTAQLAFNVYLSVPPRGGDLVIWRRRWRHEDERSRVGYGYHEEVVSGEHHVVIAPTPGEAVLFDSRHYHVVRPVFDGRRVSFGFFVGLTRTGDLLLWS
jgi:L-gamma-glutamyl-L-propargylglycine hydroxylase